MSDFKEIHAWLMGERDYRTGVMLFATYGPRNNLKNVLLRKENPKKLLYEMQKLAEKHPLKKGTKVEGVKVVKASEVAAPKVEAPKSKPAEEKKANNTVQASWRLDQEKDSEEVKALKAEFKALMDERRMLHMGELRKDRTDEERHAPAMRILEIKPILDLIDEKLQYYAQHGKLPEPVIITKADLNDRASIQKRIETLKVYIRRNAPGKCMDDRQRYEYYLAEKKMLEDKLATQ